MADDPPAVEPRQFRRAMGQFATGVAVVATNRDGEYHGMTVNSLTSVSLEPPLLLVCLTRDSRTASAVTEVGRFVVNLLSHKQMDLSNEFARAGGDRFVGLEVEEADDGMPVIPGTLGHVRCRVDDIIDGGDHIIVLGRVIACEVGPDDPLIFFKGRYARHVAFDDYPVESWWG